VGNGTGASGTAPEGLPCARGCAAIEVFAEPETMCSFAEPKTCSGADSDAPEGITVAGLPTSVAVTNENMTTKASARIAWRLS
jgi:hypothetical protein